MFVPVRARHVYVPCAAASFSPLYSSILADTKLNTPPPTMMQLAVGETPSSLSALLSRGRPFMQRKTQSNKTSPPQPPYPLFSRAFSEGCASCPPPFQLAGGGPGLSSFTLAPLPPPPALGWLMRGSQWTEDPPAADFEWP